MKLDYKKTFFLGLAFLSISSFWQLYNNIIPLILKNTFAVGETLTGAIMALDNVLALFLLPVFGALSDRVNTRFGKRTPFIIIGTIISAIFMMLIPIADQMKSFPLFFIALGVVLLAMSFYRSPAVALMPDLTPKALRSKANAVINLMGAVGAILALAFISLLVPNVENPTYLTVFLAVALLMIVSLIILLAKINENKLTRKRKKVDKIDKIDQSSAKKEDSESLDKKNSMPKAVKKSLNLILISIFLWFVAYDAVVISFSRYATVVWGMQGGDFANALMVAMGAAIICFIPIGILTSYIGRKKMIITGIIIITFSYLSGFLFINYSPWINLVFAFTGIGWAAINVNSYPMVVEMSSGSNVGKYTGLYYTFSMSAQIFTPILSGFFLENISYRVLFPYAVFFSILSLITMIFVKHGNVKPELKDNNLAEPFNIE